ncbi:MAG: hypothetical protein A2V77_19235 [Anaeromyxobacter sp. RBG_16_69_14]|nr:MAG: hypothetical protein A2V77_19235 [Anaeromyxobacter sp. RBG_16_69_14]
MEAVEPSCGNSAAATTVTVLGTMPVKTVSPPEGGEATIDGTYHAWFGTHELTEVKWIDGHTLTAVVPPGIQAGTYGLTLQSPFNTRTTKDAVFEVRAGECQVLEPVVEAVEPNCGNSASATAVTVLGTLPVKTVSSPEGSEATIDTVYHAWIGATALVEVTWVDGHTLTAVVPPGIQAGTYGLTLQSPFDTRATKDALFEVRAGECQCTPRCTGRTCGDDGCGGTCGTCVSGTHCTSAGTCEASLLRIWNTGVDANGAPLPVGSADPQWQLVAGPGVTTPRAAIVLSNQHPGGGHYYSSSDSRWIWSNADGSATASAPYTFRLRFDLTGFDPTTVRITGAWGVDNSGQMTLNGSTPTGTGTFSLAGAVADSFDAEHAFTISEGFVAGVNSLEIQVTNAGDSYPGEINPAGVDVTELTISGTPLP